MSDRESKLLLAMSDYFVDENLIHQAIHCLEATLHLKNPPRVEARIRQRLGELYFQHTQNLDFARTHLERAIRGVDELNFNTAQLLVSVYIAQDDIPTAIQLLQTACDLQKYTEWHYGHALRLAALLMYQCNTTVQKNECPSCHPAISVLSSLQSRAEKNGHLHIKVQALLSECQVSLRLWDIERAEIALTSAETILKTDNGIQNSRAIMEVQCCVFRVLLGEMKGSPASELRQHLSALQKKICQVHEALLTPQALSWLSPTQLFLLTYVITVRCDLNTGCMEKLSKNMNAAFALIDDELNRRASLLLNGTLHIGWQELQTERQYLLHCKCMLLVTKASANIMQAEFISAAKDIHELTTTLKSYLGNSHGDDNVNFVSIAHVLIGQLKVRLGDYDTAMKHFQSAQKHALNEYDRVICTLNLVGLMATTGQDKHMINEHLETVSHSTPYQKSIFVQHFTSYVRGLTKACTEGKTYEAKLEFARCLDNNPLPKINALALCSISFISGAKTTPELILANGLAKSIGDTVIIELSSDDVNAPAASVSNPLQTCTKVGLTALRSDPNIQRIEQWSFATDGY